MHRPAGFSIARWAFDGLNLKTIVLLTIAAVGPFFSLRSDVRVLAKQNEEVERRLEVQRELVRSKLDKETYRAEQHQTAQDIGEIKRSLNTIQQILMERR